MIPYRTKNEKLCQQIRIFIVGSNLSDRYGKILTDTATKTGLDATNNALLIKQMEEQEN